MRFISSFTVINTQYKDRHSINQINRIIPDFDRKSSLESIKLIMNSKEHHVNNLVLKFISSCMKIRDSLLAV